MKIEFKRRPQAIPEGATTATLAIDGMHCGSCAMSIDWEIEELEGVADSSTSYATQSTRVTYDPGAVTMDAILAAVQRAGFTGRPAGEPSPGERIASPTPFDRSTTQTKESSPVSPAVQTVTFDVPAITCGHCVATIKRVVTADVPGVSDVTGDPDAKRVTITFDAPATVERIVEAMTEWDYPPAR
ncbi:MAG: heavy-metal-associated domain-containing protein [Anaerolineae bacterium]